MDVVERLKLESRIDSKVPSAPFLGLLMVGAVIVGILFAAGARTRREVCDLRLSYATTKADSAAIYEEPWRLPLPQSWKCAPPNTGGEST